MELSLANRRKALSSKIPDIESTLNVVKYLQARRDKASGVEEDVEELSLSDEEGGEKPLKTLFELNDTLYAEAQLDETGEVGIWLGVSFFTAKLTKGIYNATVPYPRGNRALDVQAAVCEPVFDRDHRGS
jgi:hypothetical protein